MTDRDRETTVVTSSGSSAGWFAAVIILLAVVFGGLYLFNSGMISGGGDVNVTIDAPKDVLPDAPAPEAPASGN